MAPLFKRLKSLIIGSSPTSNQKAEASSAPSPSSAWTATSSLPSARPHQPASATAFSPGASSVSVARPASPSSSRPTTTLLDSVIPITVTPPTPGPIDPDYVPFADLYRNPQ
ncbi:BQ2448_1405 [Microbotryum intermedium]|uniref:BQ2448_1405 protein n=1 Tax=Microbotryum intermedium TaxID=269621 RepID=A0A238FD23_9BASI|nr:BQ2448_1405 [Microbotryum intermedium]